MTVDFSKLKNRIIEIRDSAEKVASENFVKRKVSEQIQKERYDICLSCEHLYKFTNTCKKCGCFMGVKTWMADQRCPLNKWLADKPEISNKGD